MDDSRRSRHEHRLFLFFGWFREVEAKGEGWGYRRGAPGVHALFGYMQIGDIVHVGPVPDRAALLTDRPWLHDHPHLDAACERSPNNTLYLASDHLVLPSGPTDLPGAGAFDRLSPSQVLTAPGQPKSRWRLPAWCGPASPGERSALSYHGDPARWLTQDDGSVLLNSVAKGQEFVMDLPDHAAAETWLRTCVSHPLRGAVPVPSCAPAPRRRSLRSP